MWVSVHGPPVLGLPFTRYGLLYLARAKQMANDQPLDEFWNSVLPVKLTFQPGQLSGLPEDVRRYLEHAIAPETPLASAVRLRMHGEIKLGRWLPFTADQVIHWGHGMIWRATVRMYGMPITGFDRLLDGEGCDAVEAAGHHPDHDRPEITRSAAGRVIAESVWLTSALCRDDAAWTGQEALHPKALLTVEGEPGEVALTIDAAGRLQNLRMRRWGNPGGGGFRYDDFGGTAEEEGTFDGYTIPTRLRIGWYFGTNRFEADGEFFRVTVDDAAYR